MLFCSAPLLLFNAWCHSSNSLLFLHLPVTSPLLSNATSESLQAIPKRVCIISTDIQCVSSLPSTVVCYRLLYLRLFFYQHQSLISSFNTNPALLYWLTLLLDGHPSHALLTSSTLSSDHFYDYFLLALSPVVFLVAISLCCYSITHCLPPSCFFPISSSSLCFLPLTLVHLQSPFFLFILMVSVLNKWKKNKAVKTH